MGDGGQPQFIDLAQIYQALKSPRNGHQVATKWSPMGHKK